MKEINIYTYSRCISNNIKKPGAYVVKLEYRGVFKHIDGFIENTTSNRLLIKGMIEGIKTLKEPCKINMYVQTKVGFGKIFTNEGKYKEVNPNKINGDLLNELSKVLSEGGHAINEIITTDHVNELKLYLKKYNDEFNKYENINN